MTAATWLRALATAIVFSAQAGLASAAPEVGWWWNPDESGRGYFIESQGGIFFMAAYFYADDGRARWLIAGSANADPYNFSGRLSEVSGGQTLYGPYVPPTTLVDSGAVTVSFSDDTHGTIVWPGGTIQIVRDIFDPGTASFQPESGWWWDPNQSGSGYSIEVQGNNLFIVGFMYDDAGNPVWYLSAGPLSTPTTYHGNLLQIVGGQTESGPYHPPSAANIIGTLDVNFSAVDQATLTFTEAAAARATSLRPLAGRTSQRNLQRQYKPAKYVLPDIYKGFYNVTTVSHTPGPPEHIDITYLIYFQNVTWALSDLTAPNPVPGGKAQHVYTLTSGSLHIEFAEQALGPPPTNDVCDADLTIDKDLTTMPANNFQLNVGDDGAYSLFMRLTAGDVIQTTTLSCTSGLSSIVPVIPLIGGKWEGHITGNEFKNGGQSTEIDGSGPAATMVTNAYGFDFTAAPATPP